ncbi:MAG: coproporphyrinogen dehydrogenase HemZ [Clostridia bacterium]|nr:coproporphyrinogen dehydrogenase HemZ [Clostridia bacterium]
MEIITVNHKDRYSIEQISCLFFDRDSDVKVVSEFNGLNSIKTTTFYGNRTETAEWIFEPFDEKALKNAVKKSTFLSMSKLSDKKAPWGILTGIRPTKFCRDLHTDYSYNEIKEILKNDYWVSDDKSTFCVEVAENSEKMINLMAPEEIGVYIGVPFCPSRCSYCSFISESAALYSKYIPEYTKALIAEIKSIGKIISEFGLKVGSVYVGGGTPPSLGSRLLSNVIKAAEEAFDISSDTEFTVEAGRPDVIDDELLRMLKSFDVNRLCINPQTMNDVTLKLIGRNHTSGQTYKAFELARKYSFGNINSDLIAGLPGENIGMFINTLKCIKELDPEEITVHTMYLKRTSRITKEKSWADCADDTAKMVDAAVDFARMNNYSPYYMYKQRSTLGNLENTGYAKEGYESVYNVAIMEEARSILACGSGASSKLVKNGNVERIYNIKDAFSYIRDIDEITASKKKALKSFFLNE